MSCGLYCPSINISPLFIDSFSNIFIFFHFGIKTSNFSFSFFIINFLFPLVSFPNVTFPDISANIACSLGFLASNKSATFGNPPVMSFIFEISN